MGKHHVFVYGTLKGDCHGHGRFLGHATTHETYWLLGGGFPMVITQDAPEADKLPPSLLTRVIGEVYEVDDNDMVYLDRYEGYPLHYERREISVTLSDGIELKPWMYVGGEHGRQQIPRRPVIGPDGAGNAKWPYYAEHE